MERWVGGFITPATPLKLPPTAVLPPTTISLMTTSPSMVVVVVVVVGGGVGEAGRRVGASPVYASSLLDASLVTCEGLVGALPVSLVGGRGVKWLPSSPTLVAC